ncbi:MAG: ankyrin repeat domain-containing protein [Chthoniobacter sp.]
MTVHGLAKSLGWNIRADREWSPIGGMNGQQARAAIDAILALFEEHKPDVNYTNQQGETALFPAARIGNTITLTLFIMEAPTSTCSGRME